MRGADPHVATGKPIEFLLTYLLSRWIMSYRNIHGKESYPAVSILSKGSDLADGFGEDDIPKMIDRVILVVGDQQITHMLKVEVRNRSLLLVVRDDATEFATFDDCSTIR